MVDFAWVTRGGVYVLFNGRYAKATRLRPSSTPSDLGRLETLMNIQLLRPRGTQWINARPEDAKLGDSLRLSGRDYWIETTEILHLHTGIIYFQDEADVSNTYDRRLLLWPDQAWLIHNAHATKLIAGGKMLGPEPTANIPSNQMLTVVLDERQPQR